MRSAVARGRRLPAAGSFKSRALAAIGFAFALFALPVAADTGPAKQTEDTPLAILESHRADFALRADEHEAQLALAVATIRDGHLGEGIAALESLAKAGVDEELTARCAIEIERAKAWRELTEAWLADLVRSGKKLRLTVDGKKLQAQVTAVEAGFLKLGKNRLGRDTLERSTFTPMVVLEQLKSKLSDYGPLWLRLYPLALEGDSKIESLMSKDESEEVLSLKADGERVYPGLAVLARSARLLGRLAETPWPSDLAEASALLEEVDRMHATVGTAKLFAERRPAMLALANYVLDLRFSTDGLASLVHADIEPLPDGRIRMTYDFEDEDQLEEWDVVDRFVLGPRTTRPDVELPSDAEGFWIEDGRFVSLGASAIRHPLEWTGPIELRYELAFARHETYVANITEFAVGFHGVMDSSFIWCRNQGYLDVANRRPIYGKMCEPKGRPIAQLDRRYEVRVFTEGDETVSEVGGEACCRIEHGPRTSGFLFLWVHSSAEARLESLVVEGWLDESALAKEKAAWIDEQLRDLGWRE